jgi:tetratricopeptide (TPR) repeat protein
MKYTSISLFILLLGISSCVPYKTIDIQYLNKPEIQIPSDFNKPLILVNFNKNKSKSKKEQFEYALDSIASVEASLSLKENLQNSPWFEDIEIPISSIQRNDSSRYIKPLTWKALNAFSAKDSTDLIISLDYMKVTLKSDSYSIRKDGDYYYYGYLKMPIYCYWRVYNLTKKQIPSGYFYQDTLLWDASDWIPVKIGEQLPGNFGASAYAGGDAGEKYAKMITPYWNDDKRVFFHTGSKEMEKAAIFVSKGEWIDAASEWQRVFALKRNKLSAKVAFNLALANEMLGKFDLALEWIRKAKKYYPLLEIEVYKATIESRMNNSKN